MRLVIPMLAALLLLPTRAQTQPAPQYWQVLKEDRAMTVRAYQAFLRHCPGLSAASPFIRSIRVMDEALVLMPQAEARAWPIAVLIVVELRYDDASETWQRQNGLINGISFLLGAGHDPGIIAIGTGHKLCLGRHGDFIPAPELAFLRRWPSD